MPKTISFIGTGKMAAALISAIYNNKLAKEITASDHYEENLRKIKSKFKNIKTTANNKEAARNSDIIFICVKPQDIDVVLNEIKNEIRSQLVISIAAGIKIKYIESILGKRRIIRVMPNINCLVGEMAAGFSAGEYATKEDIKDVEKLLNCAGISFLMKEEMLDIVTAISASGAGFFVYFIDAIAQEAIKNGMPKDVAYKMVEKTALGTGKLLSESNITTTELMSMIKSKKGTTEAGLKILEKNKTNKIIEKTINAAIKRSRELGR